MRILLVEDDASIREVFKLLLETQSTYPDLAIDTAASGKEAIEKTQASQLDLVLLDLTLPDAHGFDIFKRLRSLEGRADLTIVAMTAHVDEKMQQAAAEMGFSGYVTKPIDLENVLFPLLSRLAAKAQKSRAA
jgi:ribose transport system substrate-binding protein